MEAPASRSSDANLANPSLRGPGRLTRQHFALYRGYLDGVSETQLHASYGDASADVRTTRRLIDALRDTLSVLARRARDTEAAHLLRLRPGSIPLFDPPPAAAAPTLDDFRENIDPDGVYGESELLALYEEAYPPQSSPALDRRATRNARLRRRQAEALARMEASLAQDPRLDHPVDGWFEAAVTARLASAGLTTLADVIELIEQRGHRWHTAVPRLGPKGAQRIVGWLQLHGQALGHALSQRALLPRRQWRAEDLSTSHTQPIEKGAALAIAPLEVLRVPAALDGSKGSNRRDAEMSFETDIRAIFAWLDARSSSVHTRRAYRREAERLLLWALVEKGKPLSSLDGGDCAEYINAFLADPTPRPRWVAAHRGERCLANWRPFAGPLSDRSRETARSILSALCEWLVEAGYLGVNPFAGLSRVAAPPVFDSAARTLDLEQWSFVLRSVERAEYSFAEHRDRLALVLAYATGLRRAELAAATTCALSVGRLSGIEGPVWRLAVGQGRGSARTVLLPPAVVEALSENLVLRGLSAPLDCAEGTPILAQARGGQPLTPDGVGKIFKNVFANAAALVESRTPGGGRHLKRASTHWLRHTHSTHALGHGADLREVSAGLGHADLSTTSLYLKSEDAGRLLGVETLIRSASMTRKITDPT
ncbi:MULTISPECIES: phage integrase family protein [unclassified Caballeronia]|uniref:phage integrase family protein n=1 Tax=unclassified Caballeronia TaxID=2646786 RepID=UPI001F182236|nr:MULTISPECIES: phage integrase family protein [unclassified Caballeronia]MCE4546167.1 site-specific integrase [Caballeronia sp. PC1]MCE4573358.1 site-specific integrase [Caballeronia sp. CLC5]